MLMCLDFLHRNQLSHMDIKLENFLVFEKDGIKRVKLIDFNSYDES